MKKNYLKSLIGIPVGIFTLEMLNTWLSIRCGYYTRFEAAETGKIMLNDVLISYLFCIVTSYLAMLQLNWTRNNLNLGLGIKEARKANRKSYLILVINFIMIFTGACTNNLAAIMGSLASLIWYGIFITVIAIQTIANKESIKKINEKLKQINK